MKKNKIINILLIGSFVFYAIFVVWNILFKYVSPFELFTSDRYFSRSLNLIPFNDLFEGNYNRLDVWGNMLLFVPLGIYLKIWSKDKWSCLILKALFISVILEVLQYILAIGASDITDVIYNTSGFITGIGIYTLLKLILKKNEYIKFLIAVLAGAATVFVAAIVILIFAYN